MMRIVALLLALLAAPPVSAAESKICEATHSRDGKPPRFLFLDFALLHTTYRVLCEQDIEADIRYWRSMYRYYGCSDNSKTARKIQSFWTTGPENRASDFDRVKKENPDEILRICSELKTSNFPDGYVPGVEPYLPHHLIQ